MNINQRRARRELSDSWIKTPFSSFGFYNHLYGNNQMSEFSSDIKNWPIEKQYMAAKFFLENEKPLFISDAQKSSLMALNMQAVYGSCKEDVLFPEIQKFSNVEKKRMFKEWKTLGTEHKFVSMKKFVDLISNLFPNWHKNHKIFTSFELEWLSYMSTNEMITSPETTEGKSFSSSKPKLSNFKSAQIMNKSTSTPLYSKTRQQFYNTNQISSAISTVRAGNKDISSFKLSEIYKLRHLNSPEKEEKQDCTPIIMRNLFENLENLYNSKKSKKPMSYKDTFSGINPKVSSTETMDQCVERVKNLLIALDEKANEEYETEEDALTDAVKKFQTDAVESILRPKLELFSGMIKEIEIIFKREASEQVKVVAEIHSKFKQAIEDLFSYLQLLNKSKLELVQQKKYSDKTVKMLEQGFLAIKELNDPGNTRYGLYGGTKLTKAAYYQNLQTSKHFLPQEDQDIMIDIETMLVNSEEKINSLQREIKQRDDEIRTLKLHLKNLQQKSYQDNVSLSNENRELKEKLGINRAGKPQIAPFESDFKMENHRLKAQVDKLLEEKNNLYQEVLSLKARG
jgi:hypothetical protein